MSESNTVTFNKNHYVFSDLSKIAKGAGIVFSGTLLGKALLFFYAIFIARVFGTEGVGIYYLGLTITTFIVSISLIGLDTAVVRFVSLYNGERDINRMKGTILSCTGIAMVISIVTAIFLYVFANTISSHFFKEPGLKNVLRLFSISIPFIALTRVFLASTRGLKLMQYTVYTNDMAEIGLRFFFTFILVYLLGFKLEGLVIANVMASILAAFLAFYYATRFIPIIDKKIKPILEFKGLLKFSIPLVFSRFLLTLISSVDTFMLGYFSSAASVGIYNIAIRLVNVAALTRPAFHQIFNPFVADLHNRNEIKKLGGLFKVLSKWIFTISFPLFLLLIFFPKYFLNAFGEGFLGGSACLMVISLAYLLNSTLGLSASLLVMSGRSDLALKNNLCAVISNIILNYLLIPKFGVLGAAIGTGISLVILNLLRLTEVFYLMKIHPYRFDYLKPLLAGLISITTVFFIQNNFSDMGNIILLVLFTGFFCSYLLLLYLFKLSEEELYIKNILSNKLTSLVKWRYWA